MLAEVIDGAVVYSGFARLSQVISGFLLLIVMTYFCVPEVQGYIFTFQAILSLQFVFDFGYSTALVNAVSHVFAHLMLNDDGTVGQVGDEADHLSRVLYDSILWFAYASALFVIIVITAGYLFFSPDDSLNLANVKWQAPWVLTVLTSAVTMFFSPLVVFLEGCNQVRAVNKYRFIYSVFYNLVFAGGLVFGLNLWSLPLAIMVNVVRDVHLIAVKYRKFFLSLLRIQRMRLSSWKTEVWPLQWKLGVGAISNFCSTSIIQPVIFKYHGAVVAGQMGLTWQIATSVTVIPLACILPKVPRLAALAAQRNYRDLDRLFYRASGTTLIATLVSFLITWLLINTSYWFQIPFADRMLSPKLSGILFLAMFIIQVSACQSFYFRAHKDEPLMLLGVVSNLILGALVLLCGKHYGPAGVVGSYFYVYTFIVFLSTLIWFRYRTNCVHTLSRTSS